ncbi:hypothetical protein DFH06DRAFT_1141904 [Mycena polygramma]|nr:hypothetical protein DFH06DRAFT_1141904 [Mycena polygramma]
MSPDGYIDAGFNSGSQPAAPVTATPALSTAALDPAIQEYDEEEDSETATSGFKQLARELAWALVRARTRAKRTKDHAITSYINHVLVKNVDHVKVNVANMLPRDEITALLGVTYRRIPILAIGNDIYCDTRLCICFTPQSHCLRPRATIPARPGLCGNASIFPNKKHGGGADRDTGLIKVGDSFAQAFSKHWAENVLFPLAPVLLPWANFPPAFIKDRGEFRGGAMDVEAIPQGDAT